MTITETAETLALVLVDATLVSFKAFLLVGTEGTHNTVAAKAHLARNILLPLLKRQSSECLQNISLYYQSFLANAKRAMQETGATNNSEHREGLGRFKLSVGLAPGSRQYKWMADVNVPSSLNSDCLLKCRIKLIYMVLI